VTLLAKAIADLVAFLTLLLRYWFGPKKGPDKCCKTPPPIQKPDPLLYCQYYLMSMGFPVTWDNPDIYLFEGLTLVNPHQLKAATKYTVVARIWNRSRIVPVFNLDVDFSYLSFGMGTQSHQIGGSTTDLGVVGLADWPAYAAIEWTTPAVLGHYCLQVLLLPPDDSNWFNNLGQRNVFITQPQSPAVYLFAVGNHVGPRIRKVRFKIDTYALPVLAPCSNGREDYARTSPAAKTAPPIPPGWTVVLTPDALELAPGEEKNVQAVITPPAGFAGSMPFNVTGYDDAGPIGGVTLIVEA
jgi:hypothetical protein